MCALTHSNHSLFSLKQQVTLQTVGNKYHLFHMCSQRVDDRIGEEAPHAILDGKTAYERIKGRTSNKGVVHFGEKACTISLSEQTFTQDPMPLTGCLSVDPTHFAT